MFRFKNVYVLVICILNIRVCFACLPVGRDFARLRRSGFAQAGASKFDIINSGNLTTQTQNFSPAPFQGHENQNNGLPVL